MLLFHQASPNTQINALTSGSQADIASQSQISCSTDPEAAGFSALRSSAGFCLGQKQRSALPTLMAMGKDSLVASSGQGQERPSLEGFRAPEGIHILLET